jgi:hypothetical protein
MAQLLVVHHTPSPSLHSMLDAVLSGARDPRIDGVEVVVRPALGAVIPDVLEADGYLLGTPANLGYMSGALKHFFDLIYYRASTRPAGGPTASTYTGTTTPRERSPRSTRSSPVCSGVRRRRRCR